MTLKRARRVEPGELHASEMADQDARAHLRGEVDRPLRMPQPLVVALWIDLGRLEEIRRRVENARGQRTKIMRRSDLHHALFGRAHNAGNERDLRTVAEF